MKKFLSILLVVTLVVGCLGAFAGCKKDPPAEVETYDITVWVSESTGVKELTETQIAAFNTANPTIQFNATVEGVSESQSATQMITSVEDGADIFCFAQDQLARLVQAGALNKLGVKAGEEVTANNDSGAVAAATVDGDLYCYPLTSDNGYFMIYDKSVIAEDKVDSLEAILAACEAASKNFSMELEGSAWYSAGFFFATGCNSTWTSAADGKFTAVNDNFNSAEGKIALKGMQKVLKSTAYVNSSDAADFNAAIKSAVVITGTWGVAAAKTALGDNFAAADLPSFTVDNQTYHLGSYAGNKLMGVKPTTDAKRAAALQKLALFLTNEQCQLERFTQVGWGPSNKNAQANETVKADAALAALAAQSPYSKPQGQIHGSWWDIGKAYAASAKTATTDGELDTILETYEAAINGLFTMPVEEAEAFTVIGKYGTFSWDNDQTMTQKPDGTWHSEAILFAVGDVFQVRQGKSWDVQFGAIGEDGFSTKSNFEITEAGYYFVKLVYDKEAGTGKVSIEKTSPIYGWTITGKYGTNNWNVDDAMEIQADGTWKSVEAITLAVNDEFKVRLGLGWDTAYGNGAANFVVETAGTYYIAFDPTTTLVTLVPAA